MSICANRVPGIRGALCHDTYTARMSRLHNDANCLILGGRVIGPGLASEIVEVWLKTPFEGGRHAGRLAKIDSLKGK
jgi:ribose 5-phosphate isomerase B